ncbi:hypothetical protein BCD67_23610 [Oscillatoriales cyanobacterium USR001]|nr:hypothetical protein BCD67_23610 [Oscillatoriales cyanobacterium USR001]
MPRFEPKRDKTSEFLDSVDATVYANKSRGFGVFTEMFRRQQKNSATFPEIILEKLEPIWERQIEPVLVSQFGRGSILYVIFYLGKNQDEIIMEIWDPNYIDAKPSQVFSIEGVPGYAVKHFPRNRSQAEIGVLEDWN